MLGQKITRILATGVVTVSLIPFAYAVSVFSIDQVPGVEARGQEIADQRWAIGLVIFFDADDNPIGSASAVGYGSSTGEISVDRWATAGHVVARISGNANIARVEIRLGKRAFSDPEAIVAVYDQRLHPEYSPLFTQLRGQDVGVLMSDPLVGWQRVRHSLQPIADFTVLEFAGFGQLSVAGAPFDFAGTLRAVDIRIENANGSYYTSRLSGTFGGLDFVDSGGGLWNPALGEFYAMGSSITGTGPGSASAYASLAPTAGFLGSFIFDIDSDNDGVMDPEDNCTTADNGGQQDSDGDGFGNACDADINNDCIVNVVDLGLLRQSFFSTPESPFCSDLPGQGCWDAAVDLNSDGVVNVVDLGNMRARFFAPPGPSALGSCD